jgi:hypothetical protein
MSYKTVCDNCGSDQSPFVRFLVCSNVDLLGLQRFGLLEAAQDLCKDCHGWVKQALETAKISAGTRP